MTQLLYNDCYWYTLTKLFQKIVFETSASLSSCEKVYAKKVNKNAPSEKKSTHCAINRLRPVRASKMAAWKIPTVLYFEKIHNGVSK